VTALAAGASVASQVEPGVLGFLIVAGIGVALFFLLRSMNKQLRKVDADRQYFSGGPDRPAHAPLPAQMDFPERTAADPPVAQEHRGGTVRDS
jgi:hypothetical protein